MKTYLFLLLVSVGFGLTSFTGKHLSKPSVTVDCIAQNETVWPLKVTYVADNTTVLTPAAGMNQYGFVTFVPGDPIVATVDFSSSHGSTCYAHVYVDGVFISTTTVNVSHPIVSIFIYDIPMSYVDVICNTTP
jgi:hypothetical protein